MKRRRGQLILIGGLGIALTFVVLAAVLNTVIFTQNLATRDSVNGREPIGFAGAVEHGAGGAMVEANFWNASDYPTLNAQLRQDVTSWSTRASLFGASRGTVTHADLLATTSGTRILQSANTAWTSASNDPSWTMATSVTATRRFHANLSRAVLVTEDGSGLDTSSAFRVIVSDGTDSWTLYVYRSATDSTNVVVSVVQPDGTQTDCVVQASHVDIDLTEGTVAGAACEFTFGAGVDAPYSIAVEHGDQAVGRYTLVVQRDQGGLLDALASNTYHQQATGESPFTVPAIYSALLNVTFERSNVLYTRNVTVAPERVPGDERYQIAASASARELVFVNASSDELTSIDNDGTVTTYGVFDAATIGPKQVNFDNDPALEIPYVDSTGALFLTDGTETTSLLVASADTMDSLLGVGRWNGEIAVFYPNTADGNAIYRTDPTLGPTAVTVSGSEVPANAVLGITDFNGDGDTDIVYVDLSNALFYVDGGSTHPIEITLGDSTDFAGGAPRDLDRDGSRRAVYVTGSGEVAVVTSSGGVTTLTATGQAVKTPVAAFDVVGDDALEVIYVDSTTGILYYVTLDGTTGPLKTASGTTVTAAQGVGVA